MSQNFTNARQESLSATELTTSIPFSKCPRIFIGVAIRCGTNAELGHESTANQPRAFMFLFPKL